MEIIIGMTKVCEQDFQKICNKTREFRKAPEISYDISHNNNNCHNTSTRSLAAFDHWLHYYGILLLCSV